MIRRNKAALYSFLGILCVFAVGSALGWHGAWQLALWVIDILIVFAGVRLLFYQEGEPLPARKMNRREWRENRLRIREQRSFAYYGQLPPPDEE